MHMYRTCLGNKHTTTLWSGFKTKPQFSQKLQAAFFSFQEAAKFSGTGSTELPSRASSLFVIFSHLGRQRLTTKRAEYSRGEPGYQIASENTPWESFPHPDQESIFHVFVTSQSLFF